MAKGIENIISPAVARHGFEKTPFKYGFWGREANDFHYDFVKISDGTLMEIMCFYVISDNRRIDCHYHRYLLSEPVTDKATLYLKDQSYLVRCWGKVGDGQFSYYPEKRPWFCPIIVQPLIGRVSKTRDFAKMEAQAAKVAGQWADVLEDLLDMEKQYSRCGQKTVPVDVLNWLETDLPEGNI